MTTESDERPETWKPVAPMDDCTFSGYEVSDKGEVRSIDRKQGNRSLKGKVLSPSWHQDGYLLIGIRCDSTDPAHNRVHKLTVHKLVLTTFDRPCPPGMEACHSERGPAFNWWPEGIRWGTKPENDAERYAALAAAGRSANGGRLPAPKPPPAPCIRCGGPVGTGGRRCHECVVAIGQEAAELLRGGMRLEDANEKLGYANAVYLHALAVRYGGWGQCSHTATETPSVTPRSRLGRALARGRRHRS